MKILYVSPYPPARDGIGTYTRTLASAVAAAGHQTRTVTPRAMTDHTPDVIGAISARRQDLRTLAATVNDWHPDIIHVQFAVAAFGSRTRHLIRWLTLLRRNVPVPVVITMHEVTRDTASLRAVGRFLYRRLAACCDHIIVHTHTAHGTLTGRLGVAPATVTVVPHPAARPPGRTATPADLRARYGLGTATVLLAFGFIHVDKGLGDLIRALAILRRAAAVPQGAFRLVVAGNVRPRRGLFRCFEVRDRLHLRRVTRMVRRGGLPEQVIFTGYVPAGEVAAWFQVAQAVVLPYRRTEQSGVAGLADAFGVPVLASTAGGLGEQYAGSPWTFPPSSPARLSQVLADFLTRPPAERHRTATPARATDVDAVAMATCAVYRAATRADAGRVPHAS